jgi:hypothetical protein
MGGCVAGRLGGIEGKGNPGLCPRQ